MNLKQRGYLVVLLAHVILIIKATSTHMTIFFAVWGLVWAGLFLLDG